MGEEAIDVRSETSHQSYLVGQRVAFALTEAYSGTGIGQSNDLMFDVLRWIVTRDVLEIVLQEQNAKRNLDLIRREESSWAGMLTCFGQVSSGMESNTRGNTYQSRSPFGRPKGC